MMNPDVLVVGAGPAGLTTACALLQHGVSVRVVDRADGPAVSSRANILHARGVEVLHRLGALGDLPDRSVSAIKMTIHLNGKPVVTVRFGEIEGAQLSAMLVSQAEIEAELRRRLLALGGEVEWNTATTAPGGRISLSAWPITARSPGRCFADSWPRMHGSRSPTAQRSTIPTTGRYSVVCG